MELCKKIRKPSVVKIISKKQFKPEFKHDNSLLKVAKKIFRPPGLLLIFFATCYDRNKHFFCGPIRTLKKGVKYFQS